MNKLFLSFIAITSLIHSMDRPIKHRTIITRSKTQGKDNHIFRIPERPTPIKRTLEKNIVQQSPLHHISAANNIPQIFPVPEQDPIKIEIKKRIFDDYIETYGWHGLISTHEIKMLEKRYCYNVLDSNKSHDFLLQQKHNEIFLYWENNRTQIQKTLI